jgi:hypothetical protein
MTVLAEVMDPGGRRVELTSERWRHIIDSYEGHPELAARRDEILRAVAVPDEARPGRRPNERWYFLRGVGPSRWLQVVVAYEQERGWIVTAFGRRRDP